MIDWLKSNWASLAAFIAVVAGFFAALKHSGSSTSANPVLPPPPLPNPTNEQKKVEDDHDHDVAVVVEQQQSKEKDLEDDPEAENDFIKRVGEDVRKP